MSDVQKSKPAFRVFISRGEKAKLSEIGALWPTKTGNGFSGHIDAFPRDGRIILLPVSADEDAYSPAT